MSRSGYSDDCDGAQLNLWRGAVRSAIRGRRGQAFLCELASAMDAMPEKKLIEGELVTERGECCTMGVVFQARMLDVSGIDPHDSDVVAAKIGLSEAMVREIAYLNDEGTWKNETDEERWTRMRNWVEENLHT